MTSAPTKEVAHELIERMAPEQVPFAVSVLRDLVGPLQAEEIGEAEEQAVARARGESGPNISMDELLGEYGLTLEELRTMEFLEPVHPVHKF